MSLFDGLCSLFSVHVKNEILFMADSEVWA